MIVDGLSDGARCVALVEAMQQERRWQGRAGQLSALCTGELKNDKLALPEPRPMPPEHRKAALQFGDRYLLKALRPLGDGPSSELETGLFLRSTGLQVPVAPVVGALEFKKGRGEPVTVATLHAFIPNEGTAWNHIAQQLGKYYERVLSGVPSTVPVLSGAPALLEAATGPRSSEIEELVGTTIDSATLLGVRLAQLHRALASNREHPHFSPQPYSTFDQRSSYQSMRNLFGRVIRALKTEKRRMHGGDAEAAERLLSREPALYARLEPILTRRLGAERIRIHGDFHLRKVLYTGKDFVIIDFEADRLRPLAERRHRRSAVRDLASMIAAFGDAALSVRMDTSVVREADREIATRWSRLWHQVVSASFLRGYIETAQHASFVPPTQEEFALRLDTFLLAKAFEMLADELPHEGWRRTHLLRVIADMIDRPGIPS